MEIDIISTKIKLSHFILNDHSQKVNKNCVTRYLKLRRWFFLFLPFWMRWGRNLAEIQFFLGGVRDGYVFGCVLFAYFTNIFPLPHYPSLPLGIRSGVKGHFSSGRGRRWVCFWMHFFAFFWTFFLYPFSAYPNITPLTQEEKLGMRVTHVSLRLIFGILRGSLKNILFC